MIKTINQNYSKCNYYKDLDEILKIFLNNNQKNLAMFNINLIKFISDKLKIKKRIYSLFFFKYSKRQNQKNYKYTRAGSCKKIFISNWCKRLLKGGRI